MSDSRDEQAEFEFWARSRGKAIPHLDLKRDKSGEYYFTITVAAWLAWKTRAGVRRCECSDE